MYNHLTFHFPNHRSPPTFMRSILISLVCLFASFFSFSQTNITRSICSGSTISITNSDVSMPIGTLFKWIATVNGNITGNTNESVGNVVINQTLTITGNNVGTVVYAVTPSNGNSFTITVTVNPTSMFVDASGVAPVICSGSNFYAAISGVPANTQYTWSVPTMSTGITGGAAQSTPQPYIVQPLNYTGLVGTSGTAYYTVTPSVGGCVNPSFSFSVTVNPSLGTAPVISNSATVVPRCSGSTFTFNATANPATGVTFAWTRPVVNGISQGVNSGANNAINEVLNNTTTAPVLAYYFYTLNYSLGRCATTQVVSATINPTATIAAKQVAVCSGSAFTVAISDAVPADTRYTWTLPSISTGTGSVTGVSAQTTQVTVIGQTLTNNPISRTQPVTLNYTVTPVAVTGSSSCSGSSFPVTVVLNPTSSITSQQNTISCSNQPFNFPISAFPPNTNFSWAIAPTIAPTSGAITGGTSQTIAQNSISQTLVNNTISAATATYVITPITGLCIGPNFNAVVTVNPVPIVNPVSQTTTVCSGSTFTLTQSGIPIGTIYNWDIPTISPANAITGSVAATNQVSFNQTLTNSNNAVATATYNITPISGACSGASFSVLVSVNPSPTFTTQTATSCSGSGFQVNPSNAPNGTTYTWTVPSYGVGISGGNNQLIAQNNISQTLINTSAIISTATYSVTPMANGCVGPVFNAVITVSPLPIVANVNSNSCSSTAFSTTPVSSQPNTTYTWSQPVSATSGFVTGGSMQTIPQISISDNFVNTTNAPANATYSVTPYAAGCAGNTFTLTNTVNPTPNVTSIRTDVCSQSNFSVSPSNVPFGTTYSWSVPVLAPSNSIIGSSAQASPLSVIGQNLTNTTNAIAIALYTVTPNTGACIGANFTVEVSVKISALLSTQTAVICSGQTFDVKPSGVPIGTTYTWTAPIRSNDVSGGLAQNVDQPNISQTLTNNSTTGITDSAIYNVTPNSSGCLGNSFNLIILIRPLPIVPDLSQSVCSGVAFIGIPNSNIQGTSYTWAAPNISPINSITGGLVKTSAVQTVSATLINTTNSQATVMYTVTPIANGCTGNTFTLVQTVNPTPNIETQVTKVCSNIVFNIAPANIPIGTTTVYTWSAPVLSSLNALIGGSDQLLPLTVVSQKLTNTTNAVATATYNVKPISGGCEGQSFRVVVNVTPRAVINDITTAVCSGSSFSVTPTIAPMGTTYTWDNPAISNGILGGFAQFTPQGSISQQLTNSNTNITSGSAVYTVTPSTDACTGNIFKVSVTINSNNTTLSSSLTPSAVCSGTSFNYIPTSISPNTAFSWTRMVVPGINNVELSSFGTINEVLINNTDAPVTATYIFTVSTTGCTNLNKQLINVVINPAPKLSSSITPPAICSGSMFNYAATSNTFNVTFNWSRSYVVGITEAISSGSGNVSEGLSNPTYNVVTVPYQFSLKANGCTNTQTVYVLVNPVLSFPDLTISTCSGTPVNLAIPNTPANTLYTWDTPIQSIGTSGGSPQLLVPQSTINQLLSNKTNTSGTALYAVTPSIAATYTSGCKGRPFTLTISVNPIPLLTSGTSTPAVCSGLPLNYVPISNVQGTSFTWVREAVAGISNGKASSAGIINETLLNITTDPILVLYKFIVSANGCSDTTPIVATTVNAAPILKTQYITTCSGSAFILPTTLMPLRTTYTWSSPLVIPSGSIVGYKTFLSNQPLVSDALINQGINEATANYIIQPEGALCAISPFNLVITVKPTPSINTQVASVCSGSNLSYVPNNIPAGTTFTWQLPTIAPFGVVKGFSDVTTGQSAITQQLINISIATATASYNVVPISNGCIGNSFSLQVNVNSIPTATINCLTALCSNVNDTISLNFTGSSPWTFSYADSKNSFPITVNGNSLASTNVITTLPQNANTYTFNLLHIRDAFCSNDTSTVNFTQQLYALPFDSVIAPNGTQLCVGKTLPLTINTSRNGYQWYLNDTLITGAASMNYNASLPGYYSALVTNSNGCSNKTLNNVKMVQLFNNPTISFSYNNSCNATPITFKNLTDTSTTGSLNWRWVFSNSDSTIGFNTSYQYQSFGEKKVRVLATSPYCNYTIFKDSVLLIRQPETGILLPSVSTYKNTTVGLQSRIIIGSKYTYKWVPALGLDNPNITNPNFNYDLNLTYYVHLISEYGCETVDTLHTYVFENGLINIFVPKSFSPNGDGNNDQLFVYLAGTKEFHFFKIFNKFGQLMFETKNPDNSWDGRTNNTIQPLGAYVWVAEAIDVNGKIITQTGSVILLR